MNDKCGLERYQLILWGLLSQPTFVHLSLLFFIIFNYINSPIQFIKIEEIDYR